MSYTIRDKAELVTWARTIRWDWWTSPTFRYPVSSDTAFAAVEGWLRPLGAYALVGCQRGPTGDLIHPHVLIGGTGRNPRIETALPNRLRRGKPDVDPYDPAPVAIRSL